MIRGDSRFEFDFEPKEWRTLSEQDYSASNVDQYPFRVRVMHKKKDEVRREMLDKFLSPTAAIAELRNRAALTSGVKPDAAFRQAAEQYALNFGDD